MIVSRLGDGQLLVVRQSDHGGQTGLISAAWGNDDIPPLTDRVAASTLAARHHEDGWTEWERRPALDPGTGHPMQFHAVAPQEHIPAYRNGIAAASRLDPWTGLLVSMHGAGLYNDRYGTYRLEELGEQALTAHERLLVEEFLADMAQLQARLFRESVGHAAAGAPHEDPRVMRAYLLLQVWDRLSLQFAFRLAADGAIGPLPDTEQVLQCRSAGRFALTIDPYPFVEDSQHFPVVGYRVPDRHYREPEDFVAQLAAADQVVIECTASRPGRRPGRARG